MVIRKIVSRILNGTITHQQIQKAAHYEKMIVPRLEALAQIKDMLDNEFNLFSYMPSLYSFYTQIKADYIISRHSDITSFVFLIQSNADGPAKCDYICCSTFKQGKRNYESNQRPRSLLVKKRIHIRSGTTAILVDKITPQNESNVNNTIS